MEEGRATFRIALLLAIGLSCVSAFPPKATTKALGAGDICQEKVCEFKLVVREELSMTNKIKGKFLREGETMMVEMKNGKLMQKRGIFYYPLYDEKIEHEINATDDTITTDGVKRSVITVNGLFPGPTLQVMEGSEVAIHVQNNLLHQGLTLHWHGIHQKNTPWMDGVAHITQCPISPGNSFTYRFNATPSGTLWYHAHMGGMRADGAIGLLIVHKRVPTIPFFPFITNQWLHVPFSDYMATNPFRIKYWGDWAGSGKYTISDKHAHVKKYITSDGIRLSSMMINNVLINGRGRFKDNGAPLSWFDVKQGQSYGFYLVNTGVEYTFELSIDGHKMQITGIDETEIEPVTVDSIYLNPGERVRIRIEANQAVRNYWMRVKTLNNNFEANAVLHYEGAGDEEPVTSERACYRSNKCLVYNCPFIRFPYGIHKRCIATYRFKSVVKVEEIVKDFQHFDQELFLDFAFPIGSSINGYRFLHPKNHMYSDQPNIVKCEKEKCKGACFCTQIIDLPPNKTIQMVLTNFGDPTIAKGHHHTIHLHGHDFIVLKTGFPQMDRKTGKTIGRNKDITCPDRLCRKSHWNNYAEVAKEFNLKNPPMQDAVLLPYGGYVVTRIRTDNPGSWLLHCHQMMHAIEGMKLIIRVGGKEIPKPPRGFPMNCGGFEFSHQDYEKSMQHK